jgi:hypothetical protein
MKNIGNMGNRKKQAVSFTPKMPYTRCTLHMRHDASQSRCGSCREEKSALSQAEI